MTPMERLEFLKNSGVTIYPHLTEEQKIDLLYFEGNDKIYGEPL